MKRHSTARVLRMLCLAAAAAGAAPLASADGGIVKCIGADGHVTLTDTACQSGEKSVTLVPAAPRNAGAGAAVYATANTAEMPRPAYRPAARMPLARLDPPSRSLRRDVMTLRAARQALILMDSAAESIDRHRVAGLR